MTKERIAELVKLDKTEDVVEELIKLNLGLVYKQLNKFYLVDNPDALSIGYEALYKAVMTYDYHKGNKFSTYATVCIYNALGSLVRSMSNQLETSSYNVPISASGLTMLDTLESDLTADGSVLVRCGVDDIYKVAYGCLSYLPNKLHRDICARWVASEFIMTHTEIARDMDCTQSYVSQVISKYRKILKNKLGEIQNA